MGSTIIQGFLDGQDDREEISRAIAEADPDAPAPSEAEDDRQTQEE